MQHSPPPLPAITADTTGAQTSVDTIDAPASHRFIDASIVGRGTHLYADAIQRLNGLALSEIKSALANVSVQGMLNPPHGAGARNAGTLLNNWVKAAALQCEMGRPGYSA